MGGLVPSKMRDKRTKVWTGKQAQRGTTRPRCTLTPQNVGWFLPPTHLPAATGHAVPKEGDPRSHCQESLQQSWNQPAGLYGGISRGLEKVAAEPILQATKPGR
jgi:hypothetical protein